MLLAALAMSLGPASTWSPSRSWTIRSSSPGGHPAAAHPENYPGAWVASKIGRLYWNSIYVSTVSMVVTVAISALAGYGLGRIGFAGRGVVYGIC